MPLSQSAGGGSDDPLTSWNEGAAKNAIVNFVARVTEAGGVDYVPPQERIATFDNDGTLWSERPYPVQIEFAIDRVKAMLPQHPEWRDKEPFKSALAGDVQSLAAGGYRALIAHVAGASRHDDCRIQRGCPPLGGNSTASTYRQVIHRNGVPADPQPTIEPSTLVT
jgi:hypothetical protein